MLERNLKKELVFSKNLNQKSTKFRIYEIYI